MTKIYEEVQDYYGNVLESSQDLKTSACCSTDTLPRRYKDILAQIEPEILARFYGCGTPIPSALTGMTILDLGCGTGRDVYLASALVGETGSVIGIDMTTEQIEVAKKYQETQAKRFGHSKSNVTFHQGHMEDLASASIADNSIDIVISNCVINLSPHKPQVLAEIFRVLKPGGELYFSDVFSDRRIPEDLRNDAVLYGECLSGALYGEDFRRILADVGCADYRQISSRVINLENEELQEKVGHIEFTSVTVRAFKLDLEDLCEDYGQVATYTGGIEGAHQQFALDDHHLFEKGKAMLVCGNTSAMLSQTRFAPYFKITGDTSEHFGPFPCEANDSQKGDTTGGCC